MLGSSQDHKHEAQERERDYHLATAMDPRSKVELLTNHPGGRHGDEELSGIDLPSGRVPGTASDSSAN